MKIDVNIELKKLKKDIKNLGEGVVNDMSNHIRAFSKTVYNEGVNLARQRLSGTYSKYVSNLKYSDLGNGVYVIFLVEGSIGDKLENGWSSYDMKPGFLSSPKVKMSKKGNPYIDIPLNIEPHSKRPSKQRVMDMRSAVDKVISDKTIKKRFEKFDSGSSGISKYGDVTRYDGIKDPRVHGLVKITHPQKAKKGSKYFIFRRVSNASDPNSWLNPKDGNKEGVNIFKDLEEYARKGIQDIIKKYTD